MQERTVYAVYTNTDLTEGRGREYAKYYCELESTARRLAIGGYVMGTDCPVKAVKLFLHEGSWYAPGPLITGPSPEDQRAQAAIDGEKASMAAKESAIAAARVVGLREKVIAALVA